MSCASCLKYVPYLLKCMDTVATLRCGVYSRTVYIWSFCVLTMKLTTRGMRSAGRLWLAMVIRRSDGLWLLKNFCNYPLWRNCPLPYSRANSKALCWTALQETRKFSALISSIHRISNSSTSGNAVLRPAPFSRFFIARSFSKSALGFFHSRTLFSSIPCIWAATRLLCCEAYSITFNLNTASKVLFFSINCGSCHSHLRHASYLRTCRCRRLCRRSWRCGVYFRVATILLRLLP